MKLTLACWILTVGVLLASAPRLGAENSAKGKSITLPPDNALGELKQGPGVEAARANCVACHSTDYIVRQPRRDAKQWEAEVNKMVTVFGAPVDEAAIKVIVDYLASAYGPPPKPSGPKKAPATKR